MDKEYRFFENYAQTWDADRHEDAAKLKFLVQLIGIPQGADILDAGCGTGVLVPYLEEAVGTGGHIEGLDYAEAMLMKAKEKWNHVSNVSFTAGNILTCVLPNEAYDVITCLNFYPHVQKHGQAFMKRMYKALKRGGKLAILHDISRTAVNAIHDDAGIGTALLPPVDVLATMLISVGFSVTVAMDTKDLYMVVVEKPAETLGKPHASHAHGSHGHQHSHTQTKMVMNRLARVSGHIEAIKRMIEDGRDCSDVLMQLSAVDSAIVSVSKVILKDHIDHCIIDAIRENDLDAVENLKKAISTFVK